MIKYSKINESAQRIITVLAKWYQLGVVDLDYSDSIQLYCEIIPQDKRYLKVKLWLTNENQLSIYQDINGGLEHRDFVKDMAKYLETVGNLDLGEFRVEKWDRKSKEYEIDQDDIKNNCFGCYYRSQRGFCNLLDNWHPKKKNNRGCDQWRERKESVV